MLLKNLIFFLFLFSTVPLYSQSGWFQLQSGTTNSLRSIYFINSNTGWVTGDDGIILRTSNGGLNWISQTSNTNSALYGILFSDVNNGVATGYYYDGNPWCQETEIVLATTNGGTTWNIIRQGYAGRISDFTSDGNNNFYIAYDGRDMQCIMSTGAISKTSNNGLNWISYIPSNNGSYAYYSVHFINSATGWAGIIQTIAVTMLFKL